jgi:hypothetical protein
MKNNQEAAYIGQEFLLWIYWKSCEEGTFSLENLGLGEINISVEEVIDLVSIKGDGYSETIKSTDIAELDSVRESIRLGRLPALIKLRIISNHLEWFFQIKSNPFRISSVKLPLTGEKDETEMISQRLQSLTKLDLIMKALFNTFIIEREEPEFIAEIKDFLGL